MLVPGRIAADPRNRRSCVDNRRNLCLRRRPLVLAALPLAAAVHARPALPGALAAARRRAGADAVDGAAAGVLRRVHRRHRVRPGQARARAARAQWKRWP